MQRKIVVTGGAGFIGSHLVDTLLDREFDVHVVDNFATGNREHLNLRAILHEVDIREFDKLPAILAGAKYVFHTAALARVQPSIIDPRTTHDVNVNGTLNILVASRDAGVKRIIYSASSSAYGNQKVFPLRESMPTQPLSPYALQKQMGESMAKIFAELYQLETVSLRYFNVYGPRSRSEGAYALVIAKFLEQWRRCEPLTIVPDGNQSRDFTHVRDVVRANLLAMESQNVGLGEVINIGCGHDYSVNDVARMFGGPTTMVAARLEPQRTLADIALAKKLLAWQPQITLPEGIAELKLTTCPQR